MAIIWMDSLVSGVPACRFPVQYLRSLNYRQLVGNIPVQIFHHRVQLPCHTGFQVVECPGPDGHVKLAAQDRLLWKWVFPGPMIRLSIAGESKYSQVTVVSHSGHEDLCH